MEKLEFKYNSSSSTIYIGKNLTESLLSCINSLNPSRLLLIVDSNIPAADTHIIENFLPNNISNILRLTGGETGKSIDMAIKIFTTLINNQYDRQSMIISLGGGALGDLCGFVAATYLRGIKYGQIATTLLAQADASVGGKTAINFAGIKNVIGVFQQPAVVFCDILYLQSLPNRQLKSGIAEIIRIALTHDEIFFFWLENNYKKLLQKDDAALCFAIKRACELKAMVVQEDERDIKNIRALLNFGHTFGHALESYFAFKDLLHGEAIAIGICIANQLSLKLGYLDLQTFERIKRLLINVGLPVSIPKGVAIADILHLLTHDKKIINKQPIFIILTALGCGRILSDADTNLITEALELSY